MTSQVNENSKFFINTVRKPYNTTKQTSSDDYNKQMFAEKRKNNLNDRGCANEVKTTNGIPTQKRPIKNQNVRSASSNLRTNVGINNYSKTNSNVQNSRIMHSAALQKQRPIRQTTNNSTGQIIFHHAMRYIVVDGAKKAKQAIGEIYKDSKVRKKKEVKMVAAKGEKRTPVSIAFASYAVVFSVILIFLALSFSRVNEYTKEIENINSNILEADSKIERLEILIDGKEDLRFIESEAVNRLGMIKEENVQKQYVSLSRGDIIEVNRNEEEKADISVVMSGAAALLKDLFR